MFFFFCVINIYMYFSYELMNHNIIIIMDYFNTLNFAIVSSQFSLAAS